MAEQSNVAIGPGLVTAPIANEHRAPGRVPVGLLLAVAYIVFLIVVGVFAPFLSPYDPLKQDLANALAGPSVEHWLGADYVGRDVLSRLMWGAQPTLLGALIAMLTAGVIGIPWGLIAGYAGGWIDLVLMRIADSILVFPGLILALLFTSVLGPSMVSTMISVGIVFSPILARVMRSGVITVRHRDYVLVTRLFGLSSFHRMTRHVLPNAVAPLIVQATLLSGIAVISQTGLNFLGLGVPNPTPSWGNSVAETFRYILIAPQAAVAPGIAVGLTVLSIYRIGDEIRDRLDIHR
jgi:peptide/nickel transport system permease protein